MEPGDSARYLRAMRVAPLLLLLAAGYVAPGCAPETPAAPADPALGEYLGSEGERAEAMQVGDCADVTQQAEGMLGGLRDVAQSMREKGTDWPDPQLVALDEPPDGRCVLVVGRDDAVGPIAYVAAMPVELFAREYQAR